jgi:hypothetical protein
MLQEKVRILATLDMHLHTGQLVLVELLLDTHSEFWCQFTARYIGIAPPIVLVGRERFMNRDGR